MNLRHINLIIRREYMDRLRSPGFIIGTVVGMLMIAGLSFLPQLLNLLDQQTAQKIAVVDPRNLIYSYIPKDTGTRPVATPESSTQQVATAIDIRIEFSRVDGADAAALSDEVQKGKINAYITVEGTRAMDASLQYHAKDRPSALVSARLLTLLNGAIVQARIQESGLPPQQIAALFTPPDFKVVPVTGSTLKDERTVFQSQALVYFLLILLYIATVVYGVQVAVGVVFEKSSRVMEVLITSVRPIELMIGKVLGIGALGLTQAGAWALAGLATLLIGAAAQGRNAAPSLDVTAVPPTTLIYFLVFFLLGYLVFAAIYAGLGSLVNKTEDVNSITTPITLVLVANYLLALSSLANPNADYVRWLAFVPLLTPMLMFIRVSLGDFAWWEPVLGIVLMLAAILFLAWVAAKIYRVGVLLYGKRPSFREIARLLRTT